MSEPPRPRVLLADDYPALMEALGRLLKAGDCEVVGKVADGGAVLEAVERLRPDVVVLDLNMPNVDGLETCRQITQTIPETKVIILTAEYEGAVMPDVLAAGASALVPKRAISEELLTAIRKACVDRPR